MRDVQVPPPGDEVHVHGTDDLRLEHDLVRNVEDDDNRRREVHAKPALHPLAVGHFSVPDWSESGPELGDQHDAVEEEPDPRSVHARLRGEGQLVQGVALLLPAVPETDVGEADGTPGEDGRETGQGHHPVERLLLLVGGGEIPKETEGGSDENGEQGTTLSIDVREESRGLVLLCQSGEGTGRSVDGRVADGKHRNHDDHVHDGVEAGDTGVLDGDDEGGSLGVDVGFCVQQALVVVRDQKADDGQGYDVEEGDTPEDLLDGCGEGFAGVGGFGGSQADEFSTGESEGGVDEDTAESFEAVVEGAGVRPVLPTDVSTVGATAAVEDDAKDTAKC